MCEIERKTAEWKFLNLEISIFFNFSKIYSVEFFLIFLVSSSVCNKKIFIKKIWGHRLNFFLKFVTMQQDSATLIYDLNAIKGTMKSYLKKIEQAFKTEYFQA